jgi:D-lysine oxidase
VAEAPKFDVAVLGAGIVGISTAVHLAKRGASVVLVDRRGPGEETSFGNAGIIQREGIHPYLFPRDPLKLVQYALNLRPEAHYQFSSLPAVAPFLLRYFMNSTRAGERRALAGNIPLFAECLEAHHELAEEAVSLDLITRKGWLRLLRSQASVPGIEQEMAELKAAGANAMMLSPAEAQALEPHLNVSTLSAAVHYQDPWTVSNPGALVKSYAALFEKLGGQIHRLEVTAVRRISAGWAIEGQGRAIGAHRVVVALGPWSRDLLAGVGIRLPMGIKRGYHRHYRPAGNKFLTRPVIDDDNGFVLAPMAAGIRLTTGAEFARIDAPKTPVQIERCLPLARELFDLGEAVDPEPWMGRRPFFPDMLPVMGPAPGHDGLWLNFGHGHHGFTLGPVAGRLVTEMMTGETPFCDPAPYRADRFS